MNVHDHSDIIILAVLGVAIGGGTVVLITSGHGAEAGTFREAFALVIGAIAGVARSGGKAL